MRRIKPILLLTITVCGCQPATEPPTPAPTSDNKPVASTTTKEPEKPKSESASKRLYDLESLQTSTVQIAGEPLKVWVMDGALKRQEGMMFLKKEDVPADTGMIFVFPETQPKGHGFWMHNTLIPLDITYISPQGVVNETVHGKALDDTNLPAKDPFQFVIELPAGEAEKKGLVPGAKVQIPPELVKNSD